jgi:hypothetical protein
MKTIRLLPHRLQLLHRRLLHRPEMRMIRLHQRRPATEPIAR